MGIWLLFAVLGGLRVVYLVAAWVYKRVCCRINLDNYRYGVVCITGATDGIGKSMALEFAKRGFKLLLISRNPEKLQKTKQELTLLTNNSSIEFQAVDFKFFHREVDRQLAEITDKHKISVLVNNVGIATMKNILDLSYEEVEDMIGVNTYPMTMLTRELLPFFERRYSETNQRSLVINMSSTVEATYFPTSSVYSATKRYNRVLSEGLRVENKRYLDVATVEPGLVLTSGAQQGSTSGIPLSVLPDTYASSLLNSLHSGVNYGHWKHKLVGFMFESLPYQFHIILNRITLACLGNN